MFESCCQAQFRWILHGDPNIMSSIIPSIKILTSDNPTEVWAPGARLMPRSSGKGISFWSCISSRSPAEGCRSEIYSDCCMYSSSERPLMLKKEKKTVKQKDLKLGLSDFVI